METNHVCSCCEGPVHEPPVTLTVTVSGPAASGRSTLVAAIVNLLGNAGVTSILTEDELGRVIHLNEHQSWKKMLLGKRIVIKSEQTARLPLKG